MTHKFIKTNTESSNFIWFKCIYCGLKYFENGKIYFYFNEEYTENLLTCEEYQIKKLLE